MENNKISILHYDDNEDDLGLIPNSLSYLAKDLGVDLSPTYADSVRRSIEAIDTNVFDLIIIDMVDQKKRNDNTGLQILDYLQDSGKSAPVFIYTSINPKDDDYNELLIKYSFIDKYLFKRKTKDEIKKEFTEFLERKGLIPQIFEYDVDNYDLKAEVNTIGINEINTFLVRIKRNLHLNQPNFKLNRITSGLSGACIFRIEYKVNNNSKSFLLKVSKDKETIKQEFSNSSLYKNLPPQFRLEYNTSIPKRELETETCSAILIEYAENASTLFDWLTKSEIQNNQETIWKLLSDLYLDDGLYGFYSSNKLEEAKKYNFIFEKCDEKRISFIKKTINDLNAILNRSSPSLIDEDLINQILFNRTYKNIQYKEPNSKGSEKNLILCHGDFHAKNILVSSQNRPTIIDTGGFGYDYWCSDITRLIVNLFIEGFDIKTFEFFSIASQIERLETAKKIITGEEISIGEQTSLNNGFIHAINWLRKNVGKIHPDFFSEWEFQLNLGLEFFKASYKSIILPPGKRVLALMSACEAIRQANENIKI